MRHTVQVVVATCDNESIISINQSINQNYLKWPKWWKPLHGPLSEEVTVKFRRELLNVKNMIAETSASSDGDRMWCAPVDYSRCEVRQRRTLGCRPWTAWQVECWDGSRRFICHTSAWCSGNRQPEHRRWRSSAARRPCVPPWSRGQDASSASHRMESTAAMFTDSSVTHTTHKTSVY